MRSICFLFLILVCFCFVASAQNSSVSYIVPDSIKAVGIFTAVQVKSIRAKKENDIGIRADAVSLYLEADKKEKEVDMEFPEGAIVLTKGIDVQQGKEELTWHFNWQLGENYQLYIATATDSAADFKLYSGYIYFPAQNKWKLIGTCKVSGQWGTIKQAATFQTGHKELSVDFSNTLLQRTNGSWKSITSAATTNPPVLNPMSNMDSLQQAAADENYIQQLIRENKTDALLQHEGVYYHMMKEGTGSQVKVSDTVTVFYKGYLLSDGSIFDQTKERPATFPLTRLIKGWQIGVPLCKVGGKIKIVIPSELAYSIRTRSAKIPPNSILVFEIEVITAK